jgi:hypothetical protein
VNREPADSAPGSHSTATRARKANHGVNRRGNGPPDRRKRDPLVGDGSRRQRTPRRSWLGLRSRGVRGSACAEAFDGHTWFLKRQLSLLCALEEYDLRRSVIW